LIAGEPTASDVYRRTQKACATAASDDGLVFYAFDLWDTGACYDVRLQALRTCVYDSLHPAVVPVPAQLVHDEKTLLLAEDGVLADGYEGLILRGADTAYKNGRSTVKEQGMLKVKRFVDGEAEIIGMEEELHNGNAAKESAIGTTERSSHKAGMTGKGRMGALNVRDCKSGVEFKIGSGFTAEDRETFWKFWQTAYPRSGPNARPRVVVKYKSFLIGVKDKPRFPVYLGLREGWDR
jgi:DNA ligase-1